MKTNFPKKEKVSLTNAVKELKREIREKLCIEIIKI
jgi:hypothetical protein